jgi:hypothetical protein
VPLKELDQKMMHGIHGQLVDDVVAIRRAFKKSGAQTDARSFVRSLFALIEADLFLIRYACLVSVDGHPKLLTRPEKNFLAEKVYTVTDRGTVEATTAKIQAKPMLKFTFAMVYRITKDDDGQPDYKKSPGWKAYTDASKLRDRLTHPRRLDDLTVTPKEMETVYAAHKWFIGERERALFALIGDPKAFSPPKPLKKVTRK